MNIVKVDDTARAACDTCKKFVGITYRLRDVPLSDGVGTVKDVIAGVCDQCDSACVLPHQSVPAVARDGASHSFAAAVGGFEYTMYQVSGSSADVGFLLEYQYDVLAAEG